MKYSRHVQKHDVIGPDNFLCGICSNSNRDEKKTSKCCEERY